MSYTYSTIQQMLT